MNQYLEQTNPMVKEYFKILSPEGIPDFLWDYINTPEMQKQNGISVSCGTIYSKMYNQIWYSSLDHSIAVALIVWNFTKDKKQTIEIQKNEDGLEELGFKDKDKAEKFVHTMSKLSCLYRRIETKFSMQFLADIMKEMLGAKLITKYDLYRYQEKDIIEKIENCKYANISKCFKLWKNATKINQSDEPVENKYCVNIDKEKVRFINPLVKMDDNKFERVSKTSEKANVDIENTLNYKTKKYAYLDFKL